MIQERSAGAVIYNGNLFLLLHYPSGHWDFVKGKMENGETTHQTAIRETKEETGITDLEFVKGFEETIEYDFQYDRKEFHKKVVFFLAKTNSKTVTISDEHLDHVWLEFDEAMKKVTYQNAKKVLKKANNLLSKTL